MASNWEKAGRLVMVNGLVDVKATDKILRKNSSPTMGGKRTKGQQAAAASAPVAGSQMPDDLRGQSYTDVRTLREAYAAKRERLAYELASGKVCEVERAMKAILDNATATRRALERLPDRLASRVTAETDERKNRTMLQQEVAEVCREIARFADHLLVALTATQQ